MTAVHDTIELIGLTVEAILGFYPAERVTPQPILVDVQATLSTRAAAKRADLHHSLDYARLAGEVTFILQEGRFRSIEAAAETIAAWMLAPPSRDRPQAEITSATVTVAKPQVLGGRALPRVRITRWAHESEPVVETTSWGFADVLCETADAGLYRLRIPPGGQIPPHRHERMEEAELLLSAGLAAQGVVRAAGTVFRWPLGLVHGYVNATGIERSILCIDRPRFDRADEIETPYPPSGPVEPASDNLYPEPARE